MIQIRTVAKYRPNVAIIVTDGDGHVLLCQRIDDSKKIQTVQGGIDEGETAQQAAERELGEELGITSEQFEFKQALLGTYRYNWSSEFAKDKLFDGQEQTYFLAQVAPDITFDLGAHEREFETVWWDSPQAMVAKAWPPKRPGLQAALTAFGLLSVNED